MNWRLHPYKTVHALSRDVKSLKRIIDRRAQDEKSLRATLTTTMVLWDAEREMNDALAMENHRLRAELAESGRCDDGT